MNTVVTERSHNEEAISQQLNFREYFGELYAPTLRYSCFYLGWVLLACLTVPCLNVVEAAPAKRSMHSTLYHRYIQRIRQQLKKKTTQCPFAYGLGTALPEESDVEKSGGFVPKRPTFQPRLSACFGWPGPSRIASTFKKDGPNFGSSRTFSSSTSCTRPRTA